MQTFIAFLIVIGILIFAHELGHFLAARLMNVKVLKFSLGFGPKLIGRKVGDTEYLLSVFPLGGYVKLLGEEDIVEAENTEGNPAKAVSQEDRNRAFAVQPVWKRAVIVAAGPVFNFVLAYLIFVAILLSGFSIYVPKFESLLPSIEEVVEGSPAEKGGMMSGDKVVGINGREISSWNQMTEIVQKSPDVALEFEVERDNKIVKLVIIPELKEVEIEEGNAIEVGQIGVSRQMAGVNVEADHPLLALYKGLEATYGWTELTIVGIGMLITGELSLDNIGSPILIAQVSGTAASQGMLSLLMFIGMLSINLGIINLVPIPPLDGGHLLFFSIESVQARPVSERIREISQQVGIVLLILLMLRAFYNDIIRWVNG